MKNRIINGGMVIDQRNAGASITPTAAAYDVDRWFIAMSDASKFSIQQNAGAITPPVGFTNYLGATSLSAFSITSTSYFHISQGIEGLNCTDLGWGTANAQTVNLSFWVRSSLTGTFGGSLFNSAANYSYPFSYSIPVANTWTQISITITGPTSGTWLTTNACGIYVNFGIGNGTTVSGTAGAWASGLYRSATGAVSVVGTSGATFYITGVQLEKGSVATSFDYRPYSTELALCQRYYYKAVTINTVNSSLMSSGVAYTTTNTAQHYCAFPVSMRAAPTASVSSVNLYNSATNVPITAIATQSSSPTQGTLNFTVASGVVVSAFYIPITSTGYIDFSAEL